MQLSINRYTKELTTSTERL